MWGAGNPSISFRYWGNLLHAYWSPWPTFFLICFHNGTVWTRQKMGLIIYVSLLLLTPKILSLPFDPQDNAFLSWAHSYAPSHNQSNCWVCGVLPSSSVEGFHGGHLHFKEITFSKSGNTLNNNCMWCLFLNWFHLTTLRWTDVTMAIMWLFILILTWLANKSRSNFFFNLTFIKYGMGLYGLFMKKDV